MSRKDKRKQDLEKIDVIKKYYFGKTKRWKKYRRAVKNFAKKW